MIAVFSNEFRLLSRDRSAVLWLIVAPLLVITIVTSARYRGAETPRVLVPIVNDDQGPVARAFIKLLQTRAEVVETSREEAESLVRDRGRAAASLVFPEGLSRRYLQGRSSEILLLTDPAEPIPLGRVKMLLLLMARDAAEIADPIGPERLVVVEQNLTGDRLARKAHEQNVPGFSILFLLLTVSYSTATSLHLEFRSGTIQRLLVAPVGFARIVLAKLAARWVVGSLQMLLFLAWGSLVFGVSLGTSVTAPLLVVATTVFAGVSLGLLIAGIARSVEQALLVALSLVLPLAAIGGLWWPVHAGPPWMRALSPLAFPTWAMRGMTDVVLRDRGLGAVAPSAGIIALQGVLMLGLGMFLFRAQFARR